MHGCISTRLAFGLALAVVCGGPVIGWGQQPTYLADESYSLVGQTAQPAVEGQLVSGYTAADDLGARLEKVEQALKKMDDKAKADKKKAAGKPSVEVGGRMFIDSVFFSQDAVNSAYYGNAQNGVEFRTMRLHALGKAFEIVEYKAEFDFADSDLNFSEIAFKDVYIGVTDLPFVGNVRVGHFKEPFSLEELTSSRFITFMERSMPHAAFVPARNLGVMLHDHTDNQRMTWAVGAFHEDIGDQPVFRQADALSQAVTARVTYLPWYDEATEGRGLLHTGMAYSYRDAFQNAKQFRSRADVHFNPYVVDTGIMTLTDYELLGAEIAFVYGPFSVQSEYYGCRPDRAGDAESNMDGYYVQMSYFLTGEHRTYSRSKGAFDRIKPFENFFRVRAEDCCVYTGKGAWELAYRYDYVDLNTTGAVSALGGGKAGTHTFGVNWYLNPYTRLMWNFIHCESETLGVDRGELDVFAMRAQIDF